MFETGLRGELSYEGRPSRETSGPAGGLERAGAALRATSVAGLDEAAVVDVLRTTRALRSALEALEARATARLARLRGLRRIGDARPLLRAELGVSGTEAARRGSAAEVLDALPRLADALADGRIGPGHVDAVARARSIAGDALADHEEALVTMATAITDEDHFRHRAVELAHRASADGGLDAFERKRARRSLRWWQTPEGMTALHGELDPVSGAVVTGAIHALVEAGWHGANPSGHAESGAEPGPSLAQRRADALVDLARVHATPPVAPASHDALRGTAAATGSRTPEAGRPTKRQASSGGLPLAPSRPLVTLTVDLATLRADLHEHSRCHLDTGEAIPPDVARRLACDATILPVVLGGPSLPLDVGRAQRLATPAIRAALALRDGGCVHPGCTAPPQWCEAHHIVPWEDGGATALPNLVLLCPRHHHDLHTGRFALPRPPSRSHDPTRPHHRRRTASSRAGPP